MARKLRDELMLGIGSLDADPTGPAAPAYLAEKSKQPIITIHDHLENGNLSIDEVCALADRSKTAFYQDVKARLVMYRKVGRRSVVPGPIAKRYINGEPIDDLIAATPGLVICKAPREALVEA